MATNDDGIDAPGLRALVHVIGYRLTKQVRVLLIWDGGKLLPMFKEERCYQQRLWKGFHLIFLSQMLRVHFMTIFCSRDDCDFFLLACTLSRVCIFFLKNYASNIVVSTRVYLRCIIHYLPLSEFFNSKNAISCTRSHMEDGDTSYCSLQEGYKTFTPLGALSHAELVGQKYFKEWLPGVVERYSSSAL